MAVAPARLVFNKIIRFVDFADIVVVAANFSQKGVGADFRCRGFDQAAHNDRMVVGSRRFDHELAHQRLIEIGQFQQFDIGGVTENDFRQRNQAGSHNAGADAAEKTEGPLPQEGR